MATIKSQIVSLRETISQFLGTVNNPFNRSEQEMYNRVGKALGVTVSTVSYQDKKAQTIESLEQAYSRRIPITQSTTPALYTGGTSRFSGTLGKFRVKTNGGTLNVRNGPSLDAPIVDWLPNGTEVDLIEQYNSARIRGISGGSRWGYIRYAKGNKSSTGYVSEDYLERIESTTPTTTSTETTNELVVPDDPLGLYNNGGSVSGAASIPGGGRQPESQQRLQKWSSVTPTYIDYSTPEEQTTVWPPALDNFSEDPLTNFKLSNYTPAYMSITTHKNGKVGIYDFRFLIGPSAITENRANSISAVRTGGGFFVLRNGPELTRLTLSGYLLDSAQADERRTFLQHYYEEYLIDKVNAFHEYFNESRLELYVSGYKYHCILTDFQLSQSSDMMFTFKYHLGLLVLHQEPTTTISVPTGRTNQIPYTSALEVFTPTASLVNILQLGLIFKGL